GGVGDDILDPGTGRQAYYHGDVVNGNAGRDSIRLRYDNTRFTNIERYIADDGESTFYTPSTTPLELDWLEVNVPATGDIWISTGLKHLTGRGYINTWKATLLTSRPRVLVVEHSSLETDAPTNRFDKTTLSRPVRDVPDGALTVVVISNGVVVESRAITVDRTNPTPPPVTSFND
ncbi:MAG TPA: hypothetical protein PKB10_04610, partial [Tepidisphaeraceae bacterium]|nr:hypothetical protein [Tepidisphaeraceae bacterium]